MPLVDVGPVDRVRVGQSHLAGVHEAGDGRQDLTLRFHISGLEHGPGEHKLPVKRDAFRFQGACIQYFRIINQRQFSLWHQGGNNLLIMLFGIIQAGDMCHLFNTNTFQFFSQWFVMINHMMRARFTNPLLTFWTRGGANDR